MYPQNKVDNTFNFTGKYATVSNDMFLPKNEILEDKSPHIGSNIDLSNREEKLDNYDNED